MAVVKVLAGHTSPETAYVVEGYPYGFKLKCRIRYWLENNSNSKGTRFWSQTTNPKRGDVWNAPKSSTYSLLGAMYTDEQGHVHWDGLSSYNLEKTGAFLETYREGLIPSQITFCEKVVATLARRQAAADKAKEEETAHIGTACTSCDDTNCPIG